ncbi:MAG: Helix-turn-helix protein, partial [Acidimicrobiales bacterium]|nr:Helix-turn-helix protein [Acidimicrobiales bacterium]
CGGLCREVTVARAGKLCPGCQATVLSAYNREPLCAPCVRAARSGAGPIPTWVFDSAPMRSALARLDPAAMLTVLRSAAGLTQRDLADIVPGWTQTKVARVESGGRATLFDLRELLTFADAIEMPREALLPLILGDPNGTLEMETRFELEDGTRVDRRAFHTAALGATAGLMLPVAAPSRVTDAHIRYLRSCRDGLWIHDGAVGGVALLRQAGGLFAKARAMLDDSDYTEPIGRQLLAVTAGLGVAAGFLAFDANQQILARRIFTEAVTLAGSASDPVTTAHAFASMALQSTSLSRVTGQRGLAREAVRFLDQAAAVARHEASPRLHALIWMRRATASALLGDDLSVREGITNARRELERGPHPTDPDWAGFVTTSEVTGHEAGALTDQGHPGIAAGLLRTFLDDPRLPARNEAFYRALLSTTLQKAGDTTGAVAEGLQVLSALEGPVSSVRPLTTLKPVRAAAAEGGEFAGRYDAIAQTLATP